MIFRALLSLFFRNRDSSEDLPQPDSENSLSNYLQPYKLFDCVMVENRYEEVQSEIRKSRDPRFDPLKDLGVVIGSSTSISKLTGLPDYYVVGWYNHNNPESPILEQISHFELTPVIRPIGELAERSEYLNRMFNSFFLNWLEVFDHERSPRN